MLPPTDVGTVGVGNVDDDSVPVDGDVDVRPPGRIGETLELVAEQPRGRIRRLHSLRIELVNQGGAVVVGFGRGVDAVTRPGEGGLFAVNGLDGFVDAEFRLRRPLVRELLEREFGTAVRASRIALVRIHVPSSVPLRTVIRWLVCVGVVDRPLGLGRASSRRLVSSIVSIRSVGVLSIRPTRGVVVRIRLRHGVAVVLRELV